MKSKYEKHNYLIFNRQPLAGTTLINWIKILMENKFKIDWQFVPKAIYITIMVVFVAPLRFLEKRKFDKKIISEKIKAPIFIIGHWRSGTTFLHYLMGQDKNIAYASTMETLDPCVFLKYEKLLRSIVKNSLPNKRPMDDLEMDADLPYEDEYAIANLCPYSFYHGWYFPRKINDYFKKYILFEKVDKQTINEWKNVYIYFLKKISYKHNGKKIMLKSLVNTAKIKLLLEMFPDAKFIHIYRNPYEVYHSTWKLYDSILPIFSFQHINREQFDRSILEIYKQMYIKFFEEKHLIPKENLIELRYEDFVKAPLKNLETIYKKISLEGFEKAKPAFEKYIKKHEKYIRNNHVIDEASKRKIYKEWGFTFKEFGYKK